MAHLVHISEAASLAFHSLGLMAGQKNLVNTQYLALQTGGSEAHLAKVLQRLAKAGIVRSVRGPHGGFALARPSSEITLLEIYQTLEGPLKADGCILNRKICPFQQCLFGGFLEKMLRDFRKFLAQQTLADLIGFSHQNGGGEGNASHKKIAIDH